MMKSFCTQTFAFLALCAALCGLSACREKSFSVRGDIVTVPVRQPVPGGPSVIRLQLAGPELIRVSASPDGVMHDRASLVVVDRKVPFRSFRVSQEGGEVLVRTDALTAAVEMHSGAVRFLDASGQELLGGSRMGFTPTEAEGKAAFSTAVSFDSPDDEAFYGLGQHQSGELNHKGRSEELFQYNTKVSLPVVVSTRGYGLLFDAYSYSRWGNPEPYRQLGDILKVYGRDGLTPGLTGTYTPARGKALVRQEDSLYFENEWAIRNLPDVPLQGAKVVYEGYFEAPQTADYQFIQYYAGFQRTVIGGEERMARRWRPAWNPNSFKFSVHLEAGVKTPVRIEWEPDGGVSYIGLRVAPLQGEEERGRLAFASEFEPQLDFWFIGGGSHDAVIRGYRQLTGKAPVMPKWALGFWQSRERYSTQDELVGTLREFSRKISGSAHTSTLSRAA